MKYESSTPKLVLGRLHGEACHPRFSLFGRCKHHANTRARPGLTPGSASCLASSSSSSSLDGTARLARSNASRDVLCRSASPLDPRTNSGWAKPKGQRVHRNRAWHILIFFHDILIFFHGWFSQKSQSKRFTENSIRALEPPRPGCEPLQRMSRFAFAPSGRLNRTCFEQGDCSSCRPPRDAPVVLDVKLALGQHGRALAPVEGYTLRGGR